MTLRVLIRPPNSLQLRYVEMQNSAKPSDNYGQLHPCSAATSLSAPSICLVPLPHSSASTLCPLQSVIKLPLAANQCLQYCSPSAPRPDDSLRSHIEQSESRMSPVIPLRLHLMLISLTSAGSHPRPDIIGFLQKETPC